jgi:glucose-1-phosphate thymidylyltransferase
MRGELEITDLIRIYLESDKLTVELLGRGTAWLDTGSHESLASATDFVKIIERRQGLKIACLEEIAFSKGWMSSGELSKAVDTHGSSSYGEYLRSILARD